MNPFIYSDDNKRYHTLNYYYQHLFGKRVSKISLDAGFTCPNKDGKVGTGGCIFCSPYLTSNKSLTEQFEDGKKMIQKKWPGSEYIGYFQSNTNTYAPLEELKEKYELILKQDHVIGLSIGTRPDCIKDDVLDYLEELNHRTFLTVELGLQTIHEKTSVLINRGHSLECFADIVKKLRARNILVYVHIINGLPYETKEMMIETVRYLSKLDINGIKIHMLHIMKDSTLAEIYQNNPFHILTKEEYVNIVCDQLEQLPPKIVIARLTGDPEKESLIEPQWTTKKVSVLNDIDKEFVKRDTHQGFMLSIGNRTKQILRKRIKKNDLVIDATIGRGNDTLFLCKLVSKGHVYGFDIQDDAIVSTKRLLDQPKLNNYTLFLENHVHMYYHLKHLEGKIKAILFNLGYLPKGNKTITTMSQNTVKAIDQGLSLLCNTGFILMTIYKHQEGLREESAILEYIEKHKNTIKTEKYYNTDNKEAPYLIKIEKIQ